MARMIPLFGPQETNSPGEAFLYNILRSQLSNEFTVVHSLPWLCSAAKEIDGNFAPTGEIDFLIIHRELGIFALEVKSGRYRIDGLSFVHLKTEKNTSPIQQTRHNVHGLARWLGNIPSLRFKIGYGLAFPDSDFGNAIVSAALSDISVSPPESIAIDRGQIPRLGDRVVEIMTYWRATLGTPTMSSEVFEKLVETLCPQYDGTPQWATRVDFDNKMWLQLTSEQQQVVYQAANRRRTVITGWPGTGKTLIGIALARHFSHQGKRVLFLTYNNPLSSYIAEQLAFSVQEGAVFTWHGLCQQARKVGGSKAIASQKEWFKFGCLEDLLSPSGTTLLDGFDALILDEAQVLSASWCEALAKNFDGKDIVALCDETQVFPFESEATSLHDLCRQFGVNNPFLLTIAIRTPRAVTDRLLSVRPLDYQLHIPRIAEEDTLQELLVSRERETFFEILQKFFSNGALGKDIVVLSRFGLDDEVTEELMTLGIASTTVPRFRGMESPIVIIVGASGLSDLELFCAYSRATTCCVALYAAETMAWEVEGKFQELVLSIGSNKELVEQARIASLAGTIIRAKVEVVESKLKNISLAWSPAWEAWLVEFDDMDGPESLWLDFLTVYFQWPIYYWDKNSRRSLRRVSASPGLGSDLEGGEMLKLLDCHDCEAPTPHTHGATPTCVLCTRIDEAYVCEPSEEVFSRLKQFDEALIAIQARKAVTTIQRGDLPISLAAYGARKFAQANSSKVIGDASLPTGRILYRAALAFVQSRIIFLPTGTKIVVAELAKELYNRYREVQNIMALPEWQSIVANAFGTCFSKGLLNKAQKGTYSVK